MQSNQPIIESNDWSKLAADIKRWGQELGFAEIGITDTDLTNAETKHQAWIKKRLSW